MDASETSSYLRPLEPFGSVYDPSCVPGTVSPFATSCVKKPATSDNSPLTRRTFASGGGKTNFTVPLALPSSAKVFPLSKVGLLRIVNPKFYVVYLVPRLLACV